MNVDKIKTRTKMEPIAYLYHAAASAEQANSLVHSTLLVLAAQRLPSYRNETPLFTRATIDAAVSAERERCAKVCDDKGPELLRLWGDGPANAACQECATAIRGVA